MEQVTFKTSVGGFDKKSVISYIEKQNTLTAENIKAMTEHINYLTGSLADSNKSNAFNEEKIKSYEAEIKELTGIKKHTDDELEAVKKQLKEIQLLIGQKDQEIDRQNREIGILKERMKDHEENGQKYNVASSQIGAAILAAEQKAESIVASAKVEAKKITGEATSRVGKILDQIVNVSAIISDIEDKVLKSVEDVRTSFGKIGNDINMLRTNLTEPANSLNENFAAQNGQLHSDTNGIYEDVPDISETTSATANEPDSEKSEKFFR